MPILANWSIVLGFRVTLEGSLNKCTATYPPIIAPITTAKFQRCDFQSQSKKGTFLPIPVMAHNERRLEDMPKALPK